MPTAQASYEEAALFEAEVLRIVRLLYPGDPFGGSTIIEGRERDGVFITEDNIIVVEATTSQEKSKAEKDGKKLLALTTELSRQHPFRAVKGFFVTRNEPTAHQRDVIKALGQPLAAISFDALRGRLIDAKSYLEARMDHAFGSARDPETDDTDVKDEYVPLDFLDAVDQKKLYDTASVIQAITMGDQVVVVGDFGTGKSMTLREAFLKLRTNYLRSTTTKFAIHLNLNDHQGQTQPTEALFRHAELIGFAHPNQLVRAWRSGEAHIILDGFDEIFSGGAGSRPIAEVRRSSVELVRRFSGDTPQSAGVLVAGRQHYFDSLQEMRSALALRPKALVVTASDFTEDQVSSYLSQRNWEQVLPEWLPRRPLLIGYLAGRRFFEENESYAMLDAGAGWDSLLEAICVREARIETGLDSVAIRSMIARLATLARKTASGLGPLEFQDLVTVFKDLRGYLPDEGAYGVLQRLPGLRISDGYTNSRSFVDDDFADAARAGDIFDWVKNPYRPDFLLAFEGARNLLGAVGMDVLAHQVSTLNEHRSVLQVALTRAQDVSAAEAAQADLLRVALVLGVTPTRPVHIANWHIPTISVDAATDGSNANFFDCMIDSLDISDALSGEKLPHFAKCSIERVEGVVGFDDISNERIRECTVGAFSESAENTSAILRLDVTDERRVVLTVLRKIFVQSGHSRKESSLYRGSLTPKQRSLIPSSLEMLQTAGLIRRSRRRDTTLWEPNRSSQQRVQKILESPTTTDDPLLDGV